MAFGADSFAMKDSHPARLPCLVIVLGVILSLYLLYHVRDEVFFSGDGGVKALLVKQYCRGEFSDALKLTSETWVEQTWRKGLYPFGPPFVYDLPRGHVVAFPLLFPIISTPFYALLGFRGLYVIPTLSLWILWIRFVSVARHLNLSPRIIAVSLTLLVDDDALTLHTGDFVSVAPEANRAVGNRTKEAGTVLIIGAMPFEGYRESGGNTLIQDGQRAKLDAPDWSVAE